MDIPLALVPSSLGWADVFNLAILLTSIYHAVNVMYNLHFHPLSSFPGPLSHRASRLPYTLAILRGHLPQHIARVHRRYGPVVRVAPNEIAFADPSAWKDVMGGGSKDLVKWSGMYQTADFISPHIQNTVDKEHHKSLRKLLGPGFSDASLRAQEGLVKGYADLLVQRLKEQCRPKTESAAEHGEGDQNTAVVDMEQWYRLTVFDIICDLSFGDSLGCLDQGTDNHPLIKVMHASGKILWLVSAVGMYPTAKKILNWLFMIAASISGGLGGLNDMIKPVIQRRIDQGTERSDLVNPLIEKQEEWNLSIDDMASHATVLVGAGAETTASILTAATSFLLQTAKYEELAKEVRSAFASDKDITLDAVTEQCPFLLGAVEETLRMYPQTGAASLRVTGSQDRICGIPFPPQTIVGIWVWSMNRDPKLWTDPDEFHPERFAEGGRYVNDVRDALKPFQIGTRDCIGRNLATMELRLLLAHVVYSFDMDLQTESIDWAGKQRNLFIVWDKPPCYVRIKPVDAK